METIVYAATQLLHARDDGDEHTECEANNSYNGNDNLRVLAIFMILISSGLGTFFPILSSKYSFIRMPDWCFFIAKFFGSGVIVATGFIHLLEPASDALGNPCLGGTFVDYPWAFGICLMSLFALFLTECITRFYTSKSYGFSDHVHSHFPSSKDQKSIDEDDEENEEENDKYKNIVDEENVPNETAANYTVVSSMPGRNHFSHDEDHQDPSQLGTPVEEEQKEKYHNQIISVLILEFGVIFHSVFVGLSLAVSGDEFNTLFIVLVFHQMFEGMGLGARLAEIKWKESKKSTPWLLALGYTITTPIAIAIGIGVRHSFAPESRTSLIANGVFDAISAGILIYTGLVELMAHEFLYSNGFKGEHGLRKMLSAYAVMAVGAGLMALLGKWA